jgi:hypothetical protein
MSFVLKSVMPQYFALAGTLACVGCTTVMNHSPQEMTEHVIDVVKVNPNTDPNRQALAFDQTACINKARLEYPIVHIDEGGIMASNMLSGAAGGAGSGAAGAAGTGHAGQAAGLNAIGGAAQGGQNGLDQIKNNYVMQMYQQALHYGACLEEHGHVVYGVGPQEEQELARIRSEDLATTGSDVSSSQMGPAPTAQFDGIYTFVSATRLNDAFKHGTGQCPDNITASALTIANGQVSVFGSAGGVLAAAQGVVDPQGQLTTSATTSAGSAIRGYGRINGDGTINLRSTGWYCDQDFVWKK